MCQPGRRALGREILRPVKVGSREVGRVARRIAVMAVAQIRGRNLAERRVNKVSPAEPVERRCKTRDRSGDDDATVTTHAASLGERLESIIALGEMVERPKQEHRVDALVWQLERTGVAHVGTRKCPAGAPA